MATKYEMSCPRCGDHEESSPPPILVKAGIWVCLLFDESNGKVVGHDCDNADYDWDRNSPAFCGACDHGGTLGDFYDAGASAHSEARIPAQVVDNPRGIQGTDTTIPGYRYPNTRNTPG